VHHVDLVDSTVLLTSTPSTASTLLVALVGAIAGGALTIAGDIAVRIGFDARRGRSLRAAVEDEVRGLASEGEARRVAPVAGLALRSPLATPAWHALTSSGAAEKYSDEQTLALFGFYNRVNDANNLARQSILLFALAQIASPEGAAGLEAEAQRLATDPYAAIVEAAESFARLSSKP
jgi:hypothetical protein